MTRPLDGARTLLFGPPAPTNADLRVDTTHDSAQVGRDGVAAAAAQRRPAPAQLGGDGVAGAAARRRRAALPAGLASLVGVMVVASAGAPASPAGLGQPAFTVVLPPAAQVASSAPAEPGGTSESDEPTAPAPADPAGWDEPPSSPPPPGVPAPAAAPAPPDAEPAPADRCAADGATPERECVDPAPGGEEPASPIGHVFLIVLGGTDVAALADDRDAAPYLAATLTPSGTLLTGYRAVGGGGLADAIALVSGQRPTLATAAGCPDRAADGCVQDYDAGTIADQLHGLGKSWRAYIEPPPPTDPAPPAAASPTAAPPSPPATAATPEPTTPPDAATAPPRALTCADAPETTRRDPFLWFRGHLAAGDCAERNVPLDRLAADLADVAATPALAYLASDAQAGSADADAFLQRVVPQILDSPAYAAGGLIAIVGDAPPAPAPPAADAPRPPGDAPPPTADGLPGRAGALLISPFTPAGRRDGTAADHYALLRTLAGIYGVDPLGEAAAEGVRPLPSRLFAARP